MSRSACPAASPAQRLAALTALLTGIAGGTLVVAPAAEAATGTVSYAYTGGEQTFTVPAGVTSLHVEAVGGHGGDAPSLTTGTVSGGSGAVVTADLPVTAGQVLYVEVGGNGAPPSPGGALGGFNGGGAAPEPGAGGGGGASDVRTISNAQPGTLDSRLVVAGAGGGAAVGARGGSAGESGSAALVIEEGCVAGAGGGGGGATPTSPGDGGAHGTGPLGPPAGGDGSAGTVGLGGVGGSPDATSGLVIAGGGGGAGYYGGGGGGAGSVCGGGGGGGSSFVTLDAPHATFATDFSDTPARIVLSYQTPASAHAPTATTWPANHIGQHGATLHGAVNPRGAATGYYFQWGRTTAYGNRTAIRSAGSGSTATSVAATLTGLARHTTYHFRLVAVNANGIARGVDRSFCTT
jgi:hypothetical protein